MVSFSPGKECKEVARSIENEMFSQSLDVCSNFSHSLTFMTLTGALNR